MIRGKILFAALLGVSSAVATAAAVDLCYEPIPGGWEIRIPGTATTPTLDPASRIGVVQDNARLHRRPLYPPADKSLLWNETERAKMPQCGFRPLVVAYNEPRFLFDYHGAGGLLGHLYIGLRAGQTDGKWLHRWTDLVVRYVDGRMEYEAADPAFPGVTARIQAAALADAVGLIVRLEFDGLPADAVLTWAYGGASAFFTNYAMNAPEFSFSPQQCAKDRIACEQNAFTLRRSFDKSDSIMEQVFAVPKFLPEWQATIRGGSSWKVHCGFGKPEVFSESPGRLAASAEWGRAPAEKDNCVAVEDIPLSRQTAEGFIVVGMGANISSAVAHPKKAWNAAIDRNRAIAGRIVTQTPDPYLDAAATMMAFATDGTWGDSAVMHGGWSWRFGYLGWRGWYGSVCYGWTDRIQRSIENHVALGLIRNGDDAGALSSLLDTPGGVFYNMNEVFLDHVRQYFEYTNDTELMRRIFPVLVGIVDWESRRLQPGNQYLYESALNTWISDSHWYIQGQCTQASAYMLQANRLLERLAPLAGADPAPFEERARKIAEAMNEKLWMPSAGVFAEYRDTRGAGLLHEQPELATIYHSAEFGAADAVQVYRMLCWADANLRSETMPGGGKFFWSSNWFPNSGRSYTHSTYEMAYGEELNFALTNYLAGRANQAYALLRGTLCGIFNGPTPGGLSCHAFSDGRQRANDEFADAISMWGRTVSEGLFGIRPNRPEGYVALSPQFPSEWNEASIETPHFSYRWQRGEDTIAIEWESPVATSVHLRQPLQARRILRATAGGKDVRCSLETAPCVTWATLESPSAKRGTIEFAYEAAAPALTEEKPIMQVPPPKVWTPPQVPPHRLNLWRLVDCGPLFNATIGGALERVAKDATPPPAGTSLVNFGYWKDHFGSRHHGDTVQVTSDDAWRAKVGPDGVAWTADGIPFKSAKEGSNIAIVTQTGPFSPKLELPVHAAGKTLYLMLSGISFPCQSHVPHLRVTLRYTGAAEEVIELTTPDTIGDCWSTWCGRWHDTAANGFENIGGRFGPAGSIEAGDLTKPIRVDTEAHLVALDLQPGKSLDSIALEAIANDIVFGLMGATLLK